MYTTLFNSVEHWEQFSSGFLPVLDILKGLSYAGFGFRVRVKVAEQVFRYLLHSIQLLVSAIHINLDVLKYKKLNLISIGIYLTL